MCRYYYRDGLCANNSVDETSCSGLEQCPDKSSALDLNSKQCGHDKWYGLYCDRYKRFFCAGSGKCEDFEEYMMHFANHVSKAKAGAYNEMQP
jgi:hypothetical protein